MSDLVSAIDTLSMSELFTFFVRVYLRPVDADGDGNYENDDNDDDGTAAGINNKALCDCDGLATAMVVTTKAMVINMK